MNRIIGVAWKKIAKSSGKQYLSGILYDITGDISIAIFPNDKKQKDNQPDFQIILSDKREAPTQKKSLLDEINSPFEAKKDLPTIEEGKEEEDDEYKSIFG